MDEQGRVVVPKEWRDAHPGDRYVVVTTDDEVRIRPFESADLTEFFDSIEVEVESDLSDWHSLRKELAARGA